MTDPHTPLGMFPEVVVDADGNLVIDPEKIPPGFAYLLQKNIQIYEENKHLLPRFEFPIMSSEEQTAHDASMAKERQKLVEKIKETISMLEEDIKNKKV